CARDFPAFYYSTGFESLDVW
nr:immunoglobulin heavy chain junction region [Macaca mulatta]